jgi:hypothetical protein
VGSLEGYLEGTLAWLKVHAIIALCVDLLGYCCSGRLGWIFLALSLLIYPVVNGYGALCVLLYLIGQTQVWHLTLPQYLMEGRRAYAQFLCYAALFLVVTLHPCGELIHNILFFSFYFWTKIRYSDTIASIATGRFPDKGLLKAKETVLTYIAKYATI